MITIADARERRRVNGAVAAFGGDRISLEISRGMLVLAPRSPCSAECDADTHSACASSIDLDTLRPRAQPVASILERMTDAVRRIAALFVARRLVECVTVANGVVCVSRHLADRLVDRRRIKTAGLAILRHVDAAGQCARLELVGLEREVEIAGHATPEERDRLVESLSAALRGEGAPVEIRTIVHRSSHGASAKPPRASAFWILLLVAATLQLAPMLRSTPQEVVASAAPLRAPSFRLATPVGASVSETTMRGRPYAIFFGFTQCPEVCPTTLLELTRAVDALGAEAAKLDILFVSLDPERDTPRVLSDFVAPFDGRVVALSGSKEEIARAAQAFRVYYRKTALEGGGYTIDHTTLVYLVDGRGRLRDAISFMEHPEAATRRLRAFAREEAAAVGPVEGRWKPTPTDADAAVNSTRDNMPHSDAGGFA
jgi:cytochrome oxidase Cu insertion factor (SCO1/SenC/PrrC family)